VVIHVRVTVRVNVRVCTQVWWGKIQGAVYMQKRGGREGERRRGGGGGGEAVEIAAEMHSADRYM